MAYSKADLKRMAREAAIRRGVDPDIYERQIGAESNWNPSAVSPAGAKGIAQFMPGTAKDYGIDPLDPVQALDGGARYMRKSLDQFDGDYSLALASYNAGPGAVRKHGGVPPFKETQNYVAKIMGAGSVPTGSIAPGPAYQGQNPTPMPVSMDGVPTRDRPGGAPMNANDDISRALARLEQIRNGLAAPPQQPQMDPWAALGAMGAGILAGGQGHGNWFGRGMNNVMQMQAAQQMQMPQPMTPLEQLKAEGELAKMRADLMQKQAQRRWRETLSPEEQLLADAVGGQKMAQAKMTEMVKKQFGSGPEATARMRDFRSLTEELGVPADEAMEMIFKPAGTEINIGSTPAGSRPITDPTTGQVTNYQPLPGSPQYQKIQSEAQSIGKGIDAVTELSGLITSHGTEATPFSNQEIRGKMGVLHGQIVSAVGASRGMGVLDQAERKQIEREYPNPAASGSYFDSNEKMQAAYATLMEDFQTELASRELQMQGGAGTVSRQAPQTDAPFELPPGWSLEVIEE